MVAFRVNGTPSYRKIYFYTHTKNSILIQNCIYIPNQRGYSKRGGTKSMKVISVYLLKLKSL
jgi:hypothetical protein